MKIVAGLGSIDDYTRFAEAGADEFFCGYVPYEWVETYGVLSPLNRREVLYYNVQIGAYSDMVILSRMVEQYKVPVKIAFNSLYYTKEQYPLIATLIKQCMELGFDTFIIADLALIMYLREHKIPTKIHLSGETSEVNRWMMELFNRFEIKRYIFHRKITIEDMKSCIIHNPVKDLEYEAFILNENCHFTGAFCNSLHCDELTHLCKVPYCIGRIHQEESNAVENQKIFLSEKEEYSIEENPEWEQENQDWKLENAEWENNEIEQENERQEQENEDSDQENSDYLTGATGCGLCALRKLKNAGVTHLKLVGRGNYADFMEKDIRRLKRALVIMEECDREEQFQQRIKRELFEHGCSQNCYYR